MILLDYTHPSEPRSRSLSEEIEWDDPQIAKYYENGSDRHKCTYCKSDLESVFRYRMLFSGDYRHVEVLSCKICGWWNLYSFDEDSMESFYVIPCLRSFEIGSQELPLSTLAIELRRNPDIISKIHPQKFEHLVQDVLKDFFATEVSYVGSRGDGGVDLIFCDGDKPMAVQVKRRKDC